MNALALGISILGMIGLGVGIAALFKRPNGRYGAQRK